MEKLVLKENEDSSVGCESDDSSRIVSGSEHDIFGTDGQGDDSDSIIADIKFDVRSSPLIAENAVNGLIENIDVASSETDGIDPELKYTAIQTKKSYNGGSNHDLQNQKLSIDVEAASNYTDSIDNTSPAESCHGSCSSSAPSTPRVMSKHEFGKENMLLATPPINSKRKMDLLGDNSITNGNCVDDSPSTKRKRDAARPVTRQSRRLLNKSNSQDRDHESKEQKNSSEANKVETSTSDSTQFNNCIIQPPANGASAKSVVLPDAIALTVSDTAVKQIENTDDCPKALVLNDDHATETFVDVSDEMPGVCDQKLENENNLSKSYEVQSTNGGASDNNDGTNAVDNGIESNGSGENEPGSVQRFCNKAKNSCRIM